MTEPLDPDTAHLRLSVAIDQLLQPGHEQLDRDPHETRTAIRDIGRQHLDHIRYLTKRLTDARDRDDQTSAERAQCAIRQAGHSYRGRRTALHTTSAVLPSLLEQLIDAVHSTNGAGNGSRGVHRSPLNSTAVELLAAIRTQVADRDGPLDAALRKWIPADPDHAVEHAERWVHEARALLYPARWTEAKRACPVCGNRHVWITDDGQRIRKAAIQVNLTERYAACIEPSCDGWWPRERFELLAAALEEEDVPP